MSDVSSASDAGTQHIEGKGGKAGSEPPEAPTGAFPPLHVGQPRKKIHSEGAGSRLIVFFNQSVVLFLHIIQMVPHGVISYGG